MKTPWGMYVDVSHIDEFLSIDKKAEINPRDVSLTRDNIEKVWKAVKALYNSQVYPAITICIKKYGKTIMQRSIGHASGNGPDPDLKEPVVLIKPDSSICVFSTSKAITAVVIHHMHEKGLLNINEPVIKYIPEFGKKKKDKITIEQILSHRAGIANFGFEFKGEEVFDEEFLLNLIYDREVDSLTDGVPAYHAATGGFILGEIVKRVTKKDINYYLKKHFTGPMNLDNLQYGIDKKKILTVAKNYYTGPTISFPIEPFVSRALGAPWEKILEMAANEKFYTTISPSANVVSNAPQMATFFQMLLNRGELDGRRYLEEKTIKRLTKESGNTWLDRGLMLPMRYSAGMMLGNSPTGLFGPESINSFGHLGFINTLCWADPDRELSVALLNTGKALFGPHIFSFVTLLRSIAENLA